MSISNIQFFQNSFDDFYRITAGYHIGRKSQRVITVLSGEIHFLAVTFDTRAGRVAAARSAPCSALTLDQQAPNTKVPREFSSWYGAILRVEGYANGAQLISQGNLNVALHYDSGLRFSGFAYQNLP